VDTIFALATARGKAGVAVVRVSGARALDAGRALGAKLRAPRYMERVQLQVGAAWLDDALVTSFVAPASYTAENIVEFHLHGGMATVQAVLAALAAMPGLRMAEPGEFTRRALENGKLDLGEVEGLADLIDAETDAQRKAAKRQLDGHLGRQAAVWRQQVLDNLALLEASIDFSEEDLPEGVISTAASGLTALVESLEAEHQGLAAATALRNGFEVAVIGPPNAGKSTLINRLAGRDVAMTSDIPGTTRDVLEARINLGGIPVTLLDTAGLREADDRLEAMGVQRGQERAAMADIRVVLWDGLGSRPVGGPNDIVVRGKRDLLAKDQEDGVSGLDGRGIPTLLAAIAKTLEQKCAGIGVVVHERHDKAVQTAMAHLTNGLEGLRTGLDLSLVCEEVRLGARALATLTGKVDTEDVLGHIFSRFCIGK
jgi:tRNA modification GTPase